jgi:hypothetical protein
MRDITGLLTPEIILATQPKLLHSLRPTLAPSLLKNTFRNRTEISARQPVADYNLITYFLDVIDLPGV